MYPQYFMARYFKSWKILEQWLWLEIYGLMYQKWNAMCVCFGVGGEFKKKNNKIKHT